MLEGFTILNGAESKKEEAIVTISKTSMNFTMRTVENFKCPRYVVLGVNPELGQLGVAATAQNEIALSFCAGDKPQTAVISAGIWRKHLCKMMPEWNLDQYNYKVDGHFNEDHTEMIFNLKDAVKRNKRKRNDHNKEIEPQFSEEAIKCQIQPEPDDTVIE